MCDATLNEIAQMERMSIALRQDYKYEFEQAPDIYEKAGLTQDYDSLPIEKRISHFRAWIAHQNQMYEMSTYIRGHGGLHC